MPVGRSGAATGCAANTSLRDAGDEFEHLGCGGLVSTEPIDPARSRPPSNQRLGLASHRMPRLFTIPASSLVRMRQGTASADPTPEWVNQH